MGHIKHSLHASYLNILDKNFQALNLGQGSNVLDVGCGNGSNVKALREMNFNAYGIDIEFKPGPHLLELKQSKIIKLIKYDKENRSSLSHGDEYVWPTFDRKFDVIVSRAVLEHVVDIESFIKQTLKNLKEKGQCIHYYPSKLSVIEPHTGVPFGALIQSKTWYRLMCSFGLCLKKFRNNGSGALDYMKNYTNFRWQYEIDRMFINYGFKRSKAAVSPLRCHPKSSLRLMSYVPGIDSLFKAFRSNVVIYTR